MFLQKSDFAQVKKSDFAQVYIVKNSPKRFYFYKYLVCRLTA